MIMPMQGGFHGRTFGAMALTTSKAVYRQGFAPLMGGVSSMNDAAQLCMRQARTCCRLRASLDYWVHACCRYSWRRTPTASTARRGRLRLTATSGTR